MADTILTRQQIEDLFWTLTCQLLGLDPTNLTNASAVRIAWPTDGAPAWAISDDVVFLRVTPGGGPIIQQRDMTYAEGTVETANVTTSYTRVWDASWIVYGPNSSENADLIRSGLYGVDLSANNLYLVLDLPNPQRAPELFDGRWWERSDFAAQFNELVQRQGTVPTISGVNIQIETEGGVTEDVNLTT